MKRNCRTCWYGYSTSYTKRPLCSELKPIPDQTQDAPCWKPRKFVCCTGVSFGSVEIKEVTCNSFPEWIERAKPTKKEAIESFLSMCVTLFQNAAKKLRGETGTTIGITIRRSDTNKNATTSRTKRAAAGRVGE